MRCSMVWDLLRTKKEKPAAGKTGYWRTFWRSGWDSNPRNLAVQLISSQSRYDHFDTAPYLSQHQYLGKRGELMGRTSKNIKFRIPEKPRKIKGFRNGGFPIATTISSLCVNCLLAFLQSRTVPKKSRLHKGFSDEMTLKGIVRDGSNIISIFPYPSKIRKIGGMFGGMLYYFL